MSASHFRRPYGFRSNMDPSLKHLMDPYQDGHDIDLIYCRSWTLVTYGGDATGYHTKTHSCHKCFSIDDYSTST